MRYLHGAAVDQILAQETAGGTVRWMLADHQGTVRDLATNTGDVTGSHVVFDSFGNVKSGTLGTRFAYTGQEYDSTTGLYYYNARWYNPKTGRFVSKDPIGFGGGDTNQYRYVGNGAANLIDPSGMRGVQQPDGSLGNGLSESERSEMVDFLLASGQRPQVPQPPITEVPGVFTTAIHLNDGYFGDQMPPPIVCHGMSVRGRVGPTNSFRFPGGPGELQSYKNWGDTSFVGGLAVGAGVAGVQIAGAGAASGVAAIGPVGAAEAGGIASQIAGPGQQLAGQISTIAKMRPVAERIKDVTSNPSAWKVVRTLRQASSRLGNKGGCSVQETLRNQKTGETLVRHTIYRSNGRILSEPHFRPPLH